jgi:hypothetical protein
VLALRKPVISRFKLTPQNAPVDSIDGEFAIAIGSIPAGGAGRVDPRGSAWSARHLVEIEMPPACDAGWSAWSAWTG